MKIKSFLFIIFLTVIKISNACELEKFLDEYEDVDPNSNKNEVKKQYFHDLVATSRIGSEETYARALLYAARRDYTEEIIALAKKPLANVNSVHNYNRSPLHVAAIYGRIEAIKVLLKLGADINAKDSSGNTALHFASSQSYAPICELLLKNGATHSTNLEGMTPLHEALNGNLETLEVLLKNMSESEKIETYYSITRIGTPLHHLIRRSMYGRTAKYLLKHASIQQNKSPVLVRDMNGNSPIHICIEKEQLFDGLALLRDGYFAHKPAIPPELNFIYHHENKKIQHFFQSDDNDLEFSNWLRVSLKKENSSVYKRYLSELQKALDIALKIESQEHPTNDSFSIAPKYLTEPPAPALNSFYNSSSNSQEWIKKPSLSLSKVHINREINRLNIAASFDSIFMKAKLLSLQKLNNFNRVTFVFPGRLSEARVPLEDPQGGHVVLVVPQQDFNEARMWLNDYTSILVVEALSTHGMQIPKDDLGLITARRLAALYFAYFQKLQNFCMLDDNIKNFYVADSQINTWAKLYEYLQNTARQAHMSLLSVRSHNPILSTHAPSLLEVAAIAQKISSKIFYFDSNKIFAGLKVENVAQLLPFDMKLWGEDIWMQFYVEGLNMGRGIASRESIVLTRVNDAAKRVCAKTIKKAEAWLIPELEKHFSGQNFLTNQVFKRIKNLVQANLKANDLKVKNVQQIDLGFHCANNDKKRKEREREDTSTTTTITMVNQSGGQASKRRKTIRRQLTSAPILSSPSINQFSWQQENNYAALVQKLIENIEHSDANLFFPHQLNALKSLYGDLSKNLNHGYFNMATGTGKTNVFLSMAALALLEGQKGNVAIITPTVDLVDQVYADIDKWNNRFDGHLKIDKNNVIKISHKDISQAALALNLSIKEGGKIVIFCQDSFQKLLESSPSALLLYSMVIVDEMHAINEALLSSLKTYNNTHKAFLYGFSATPSSTKTQYFGNHVIFTYQSSQAIEDGVLAPWIFKTLEYDIKIPAEVQRFKNELAHFLKNEPHPGGGTLADNRGVIWVPSIVFADELASQLQKDGFKAVAIHSSSLKARELINKFSKNSPDITILVAVDMLKLGFDAAVDFEIIAKKVIKPAEWKQMLGRALRGGRLFDKASDLEEGCFKASGSKIAYIFALRNSIDEKITTSLSARALAQLALDPDYIAHPFRDSDIQDAASNDAEDFDEEQWWKAGCPPLERPFDGFIGNITKLETSRGKKHSVVIQQFKTDDNEFSALGINRQDFIKRVYVQNADPNFASLRWQAIESLSMHSLHEWEYLYGQRDVMGRPKYNLNIEHLKLISLIYNVKLYLYTIEDPDIELILTPLEDYSVIYEGPNLYESKDLHLANIGMPEFKRFERMLFTDEYADNHSIISPYTQEGLEGLFSDDANYGRYFNPTYPYLNNLINLLSDHR